jgi:hypothetical protein
MTWRSLSQYWEEMGGDPELEPQDASDELALRQADEELVDTKDLPF